MKSNFILMNKDIPTAKLGIANDCVYIQDVYSNIPSYLYNINTWITQRATLFGRPNLLNMAKISGISNEFDYLTISKAISINDTFWVNDLYNPTTWDCINPYKNRLSKIMADIAIDGVHYYKYGNLKYPSPQYRLDGVTDKCVRRIKDTLYLYKTSGEKWNELAGNRPYSEYYASKVAKKLELNNYTDYNIHTHLTENNLIKPYAICKIFTTEDIGLLHMVDSKYRNVSTANLLKNLPKHMSNQLREMILLDCITLNFDRHSSNYGFLVDNSTFKILDIAPIYDNDCSLGSFISIDESNFNDTFNEAKYRNAPKIDLGNYDEAVLAALTKGLYNKLRNAGYIKFDKKLRGLSEKRYNFMEYLVNRRIKEILALVSGG